MKRKSLYFISGIVVLIASALILTIYDESITENDAVETTRGINKQEELTGTPTDNYSLVEQEQHCGKPDAGANIYIQEYEIPTPCTQPLAIATDSAGGVWFIQTNTGNLAKFDPSSETFTEYANDKWNSKRVSMAWGMVYTEDNEIWFTDEAEDSLWRFSINNETYTKFNFPGAEKSFPQKIGYHDGNFLINDFTGNRLLIVSHDDLDKANPIPSSITTPMGFFTSQASIDNHGSIWFVMWKYQKDAVLIKADSITHETEQFPLPENVLAPNGVSVGPSGKVWIADTGSSSFFSFNPKDSQITEYITSDPPVWTFGNSSGLIKTPITRPYWNAFDSDGKMWFNQQTANRMAVFDPVSETLVEYDIPSKNPNWADCGDMSDCGVSQNFGFAFREDQVWFTEWAENNIGFIDTSIEIPISISIEEDEIEIKKGEQKEILVTVLPKSNQKMELELFGNSNSELIKIKSKQVEVMETALQIPVVISVDENIHEGYYKILLSTQLPDVSVSSYATLRVI